MKNCIVVYDDKSTVPGASDMQSSIAMGVPLLTDNDGNMFISIDAYRSHVKRIVIKMIEENF